MKLTNDEKRELEALRETNSQMLQILLEVSNRNVEYQHWLEQELSQWMPEGIVAFTLRMALYQFKEKPNGK